MTREGAKQNPFRPRLWVIGAMVVSGLSIASVGIATASHGGSSLPSPIGGGGPAWTSPVASTPCHSSDGTGVCFTWSEQASGTAGPWLLRLTDSTVVPPAPAGETARPVSSVDVRFGPGEFTVPIGGQTTVSLASPGPYGVTEMLVETLCGASGCGSSITSYAYSSVTTG